MRWNTQASRETGQEIARSVGASVTHSGFNFEMYSGECLGLAPALQAQRAKDSLVYENHPNDSRVKGPLDVCEQLTARNGTGGGNLPLVQEVGQYTNGGEIVETITSKWAKGVGGPSGSRSETGNMVIEPTYGISGNAIGRKPENGPQRGDISKNISHTLTRTDKHAVGFHARQTPVHSNGKDLPLEAQGGQAVHYNMVVRRLTPVECERLQGFSDNWTKIPWRNKPPEQCPDGPRYKAIGNAMCVNVVEFIARRIRENIEGV